MPPCFFWQGGQKQRKLYLALSSDTLRRDMWQFIHFQLSSLTCVALAWKRDEEPGHAATHIITLCIYQTIRQSIIINLPSSRELACFIFLHARNLQRISEANIFSRRNYFKTVL